MDSIRQEAESLFEYTRELRRDFHRHPEMGMKEFRSAKIIAAELTKFGYQVQTGVGETGVVGLLQTGKPGLSLLLRFDMDALPILEDTGAEYASCNPGVMHACGHDAHMSAGLTVACLLMNHREDLVGNIKLMFQPGEEGLGGAAKMIRDGVLENPVPDHALSLHVWNDKPVGWMAVTPGPLMAGASIFKITITGKGGHGAAPHLAVDPVLAGAQVITALQSIISRNVPPSESAVVSVTMMQAGDAFNIIPQTAVLQGTVRAFNPELNQKVLERLEGIAKNVSAAMGCTAEVKIDVITPPVINDSRITSVVEKSALAIYPDSQIVNDYKTMGSEDMAFVLEKIPGCFFLVGSANADKNLVYGHHHPKFDFDEDALPRAAAVMTAAVLELQKM